jgi:ribosome-associated toxin RatA of RatAB toxin-antitoxin module
MAAIQVRKSALVMQPAPTMFDLIEGAEHYPHFLPWCAGATILARDDSLVSADIHVDYRGLRFTMRTRNPKRKPEFMAIHLERGPFRHFYGEWRLLPLAHDACKVEFELHYEFDSSLATRLAGPVFAKMADTLVDAFVKRAHAMPPAAAVVTVPVVASPPASSAAPSPPAERSSAAPSCDAPSCDESARPASSSALPATTAPPTAPPAASAPTAAPDAPAPGAEAPPS